MITSSCPSFPAFSLLGFYAEIRPRAFEQLSALYCVILSPLPPPVYLSLKKGCVRHVWMFGTSFSQLLSCEEEQRQQQEDISASSALEW